MAKIVIIGAGLTGISAAYHLEKKGFTDYKIFEKCSSIGGLCGSVQQDGFTFDYTGHLLHINDDYFRSLIADVVGLDAFNVINRRSYIYSHGRYSRYPFQMNLFGLPEEVIVECIEGFVQKKSTRKKPHTFAQWVYQQFGTGFAKHFFLPYQKKIFAYNLNKITASWTGRFVPKTTLAQIIRGTIQDNSSDIGYNAQFYYPKEGGILSWVTKFADQIEQPIHTDFSVTSVDLSQKIVHFSNGHTEPFEQLISTIPLDQLLGKIIEPSTTTVCSARDKLICNAVVNFNLGIAQDNLSDKHWVYYPEKQYPFYRIGFPHNFAQSMAPKGHSSLYGEFAYVKKSQRWIQETLKKALAATKEVLAIDQSAIVTEKIMHISHGYVIFDTWREHHLPKLLDQLERMNVHSIGRYGAWKYSSMQEAVLDGKTIAERLVILPAQKAWDIRQQTPLERQKELS